jgi:hypothetical protein
VPGGGADLRRHGVADQRSKQRAAGHTLLGDAERVALGRNGTDVRVDGGLPFVPLAEVDLTSRKVRPSALSRGNARRQSDFGRRQLVNHDLRPKLYSGNTLEKDDSLQFSSCARPQFDPRISFVLYLFSLAPVEPLTRWRGEGQWAHSDSPYSQSWAERSF